MTKHIVKLSLPDAVWDGLKAAAGPVPLATYLTVLAEAHLRVMGHETTAALVAEAEAALLPTLDQTAAHITALFNADQRRINSFAKAFPSGLNDETHGDVINWCHDITTRKENRHGTT